MHECSCITVARIEAVEGDWEMREALAVPIRPAPRCVQVMLEGKAECDSEVAKLAETVEQLFDESESDDSELQSAASSKCT
eukprot:1820664-Rhodomonas_salina.3